MLWKQDFKIKPTFNCSIDGIDGIDGSALPSMLHQTLENVLMIAENVSCSIIGADSWLCVLSTTMDLEWAAINEAFPSLLGKIVVCAHLHPEENLWG